jgi:RNA polymerase sigma-70 factor (ECF subfamily)
MEPDRALSRDTGVETDEVAALYAWACPALVGLLTAIGGSRADAEEVAQDAFVRLLEHWGKVRDYADPEAWLRTVAVRMLVSRHRRRQVAARGLALLGRRAATAAPATALGDDVELAEALASLPVDQRVVLVLHHLHDLSVAEVAELLHVPTGTVKSRLSRARGHGAVAGRRGTEHPMNDFGDRLRRHVHSLGPEQSAPFQEVLTRRDRRRRRRRALAAGGTAMVAVAVVAIAIGTTAVGSDNPHDSGRPATSSPSPSPTEIPRAEPTYELSNKPSPVVLRLADRDIKPKLSSYCWMGPPARDGLTHGKCSDGYWSTSQLKRVGSPASVAFWFGVEGWDFQATFTELDVDCPRQHTVQAVRTGDQTFRLDPAGLAGRYRVDLFGQGRGSVSTSFVWTTPTDGPTDQPAAYIALVSGDRDELVSYGLEVGVDDLAFQPREAGVEVTVTAANGRSMILDVERDDPDDCFAEGSVSFRGDDVQAQEAARLGPPPFTYRVRLTLDGKRYVGTAVWPRDEEPDMAPNTVLTFDPPLPAFNG